MGEENRFKGFRLISGGADQKNAHVLKDAWAKYLPAAHNFEKASQALKASQATFSAAKAGVRVARDSFLEAWESLEETKDAFKSTILGIARVRPEFYDSADVAYTEPDKKIDVLFGHDDILSLDYGHYIVYPDGTVARVRNLRFPSANT